jgi:hypothetical protein
LLGNNASTSFQVWSDEIKIGRPLILPAGREMAFSANKNDTAISLIACNKVSVVQCTYWDIYTNTTSETPVKNVTQKKIISVSTGDITFLNCT